ncbi:MAG: enoyl-CoA hydratase/isomerase family protein [Deltaproteobacteria bacterium]|nr:enoyl-CoA hydratase/isomerase family protein [Deltaproteobacteria bacterium]
MDYKTIIYEVKEKVAVIKFNRPKALNAINSDMLKELSDVLNQIESNPSIRVLVLMGEGERAFVAGADIAHLASLSPIEGRDFSRQGQDLFFRLESLSIPVIACVNGFALGGGTEIAMSCDFIYASEKAKFGQPEINLGLIPGFGGTQRLPRIIGKGKAKELCMTGGMINAAEAKEIGLVNKVFPPEALLEETMKTANTIALKGRVALKGIKDSIERGSDVDLRDGCYMESDTFGLCKTSPDAKEGMTAFLEKRDPHFQ